jgi:hypothetical protein
MIRHYDPFTTIGVVTFALKPDDAKKLDFTERRKATIRLDSRNGTPQSGEILKIQKPCGSAASESPGATPSFPVELDAKMLDYAPHVGAPRPYPLILGENDGITAYVDSRHARRSPSGGVIFSDGIENDRLEFNSGFVARIRPADRKARLIKK